MMKSPFTGKEMNIMKEYRTLSFRKEDYTILAYFYKCEDTNEQFEDEHFAQLNYNQLVNQYREKHSILFPEQIIAIREKYGISASKMAEILGLGTNSYRLYENGEIPSLSNSKLIQIADDPCEFKKLVENCKTLDTNSSKKIINNIYKVIDNEEEHKKEILLERYLTKEASLNVYTGYKVPNLCKFKEMIVFFSEIMEPWKTKLNKLLFYSDFENYKRTGFSISGMQYQAITLGPVPYKYDSIFEYIESQKDSIKIYSTVFDDGNVGEQFKTVDNRKFNNLLFSNEELEVLHDVAKRFQNTSTKNIIEISHKEKAWLNNKDSQNTISYQYGFELNEN